jgi:hypothetical protein
MSGMPALRTVIPRSMRQAPLRDARYRDQDNSALTAVMASRPLKPPGSMLLEERRVSAAEREAAKLNRAGGA